MEKKMENEVDTGGLQRNLGFLTHWPATARSGTQHKVVVPVPNGRETIQ